MTDKIHLDTTAVLRDFRDEPMEYATRQLTPAEQSENAAAVAAARSTGIVPTLHSLPMAPLTLRAAIQEACAANLPGDEGLGAAKFDVWAIGMEAKNALGSFEPAQITRLEGRIGASWNPQIAGAALALLREAKAAFDKAVLDKATDAGKAK